MCIRDRYFFSLDAGSLSAVWAARSFYHLPYFHAVSYTHLDVYKRQVEGAGLPDGADHRLDLVQIADVTPKRVDRALSGKFGCRVLQHLLATAADVDCGAKLEEAVGHGFAESGAAAGDEDCLLYTSRCV